MSASFGDSHDLESPGKISTNMLLSSWFWHSFCRTFDTLCPYYFILSINVKVLVSFTCKNDLVLRDASLQGLTKRSDRSKTIKFYRIQVS